MPGSVCWTEDVDEVLDSDIDVFVELAGGLDPAGTWVRRALASGKSVVTANKALIAAEGVELGSWHAAIGSTWPMAPRWPGECRCFPAFRKGLRATRW